MYKCIIGNIKTNSVNGQCTQYFQSYFNINIKKPTDQNKTKNALPIHK